MEEFHCKPTKRIPQAADTSNCDWDSEDEQTRMQRCLDALAGHEAAIDAHHREIVVIRRELNQLRPINARLPRELLADIFILYADTHAQTLARRYSDSRNAPEKHDFPCRWIDVSHVCHYWRRISLSTPRLWRHIIVNRPQMAMECIARSQSVPLVVWRFGDSLLSPSQEDAIRVVLPQLSRISDLRISTFDQSFTWLPEDEPRTLSAPLLTTLFCARRGYSGMVLPFILKLNLPRLSRLILSYSDSHGWLSLQHPPNLEYLRVFINHPFPSPPENLDLHGRLSSLRTLIIINRSYEPDPNEIDVDVHPELPALSILQISSHNFRALLHYLRLFKFPASAQIRLSTSDQSMDFKQLFGQFGNPVLRSFAVRALPSKGWFTLCGWTEQLSIQHIRAENKPPLLALDCLVSRSVTKMEEFSTSLEPALRAVQTLELVQTDEYDVELFPMICKHAGNVLEVGMDGILDYMEGVWGSLPLQVQTLTMQSTSSEPPLRDRLRGFLQSRVDSGTRLHRLEVPSSGVKEEHLARLKTLVGEVVEVTFPKEVRPWDSYEFH